MRRRVADLGMCKEGAKRRDTIGSIGIQGLNVACARDVLVAEMEENMMCGGDRGGQEIGRCMCELNNKEHLCVRRPRVRTRVERALEALGAVRQRNCSDARHLRENVSFKIFRNILWECSPCRFVWM